MPRILVVTDTPAQARQTLMDELATPDHLRDDHSASQIAERLAWAVEDADRAERALHDAVSPRSYTNIPAG